MNVDKNFRWKRIFQRCLPRKMKIYLQSKFEAIHRAHLNLNCHTSIQMLEPTEAPHLINLLQQLQAKESTDDEATVGKEPPSEDELSAAGTVAAPIPQ